MAARSRGRVDQQLSNQLLTAADSLPDIGSVLEEVRETIENTQSSKAEGQRAAKKLKVCAAALEVCNAALSCRLPVRQRVRDAVHAPFTCAGDAPSNGTRREQGRCVPL